MHLFKFTPSTGQNFGDEIGPLLCQEILDRAGLTTPPGVEKLISVGSCIHFSKAGDTVWGSGINGKVSLPIQSLATDYRAVRGKLTREILCQHKYTVPEIFGDPALLLPTFFDFRPLDYSSKKILIIPNYGDFSAIYKMLENTAHSDTFFLAHPFTPLEIIVGLIQAADAVITTSLHALILADVYGIANALIGGKGFCEHPFKYADYATGIGAKDLFFYQNISDAYRNLTDPRPIHKDLTDALLQAFPYDKFVPKDVHTEARQCLPRCV